MNTEFIAKRRNILLIEKEQMPLSRVRRIFAQGDYFVDCYCCEHYDERDGFCLQFKTKIPTELAELGCGKGVEDIPF